MVTITSVQGIDDEHDKVWRCPVGPHSGLEDFLPGRPILELKLKSQLTVADLARSLVESTIDRPVPVWLQREWGSAPLAVVITTMRAIHDYPEPDSSLNYWKASGHIVGAEHSSEVRIAAVGMTPAESGEIESYMWQIASDDPIASEDEYIVIDVER